MAKIMLREKDGKYLFYLAKKDMEEVIDKIEFDSAEKWGGNVTLENGEVWNIPPFAKKLPCEVECKRISQ